MKAEYALALSIAVAGCIPSAGAQAAVQTGAPPSSSVTSSGPASAAPSGAASSGGAAAANNSAAPRTPASTKTAAGSDAILPAGATIGLPSAPEKQTPVPANSAKPSAVNGAGALQNPASSGVPAPGGAITLEEAIRRAQLLDQGYLAAQLNKGTADAQKTIARAAVLPNVDYHNQVLYTEPQRPYEVANPKTANTSPNPIFIANNAVREYTSQGVVTETIGLGKLTDLRKAEADAAVARAKLEVARRGLVATVVGDYYGLLAAQQKQRIAQVALDEANHFVTISRQLEAGGEAAHADVLRAQLQQQQRQRDALDAQLAADKARIDLGVILFPDPMTSYALAADLEHPPALASRAAMETNARSANVDVKAAMASLRSAELGVASSRAAYLPDLSLAYNYGIDADHFATRDADGIRNLGYSATATLDIPVWDWFATRAKVKQSQLQATLAKAELTNAQRRVVATFQENYSEADIAFQQFESLRQSVADAREALRLTDLRYSAGEGSVLEVVDAQNTLVTAQSALADGVVRYYTALANLQTLTGNLP